MPQISIQESIGKRISKIRQTDRELYIYFAGNEYLRVSMGGECNWASIDCTPRATPNLKTCHVCGSEQLYYRGSETIADILPDGSMSAMVD